MPDLGARLGALEPRWRLHPPAISDRRLYDELLDLRNALAHGNESELTVLRRRGVADTVAAMQGPLAALDRLARALDEVVWDHLSGVTGKEPW